MFRIQFTPFTKAIACIATFLVVIGTSVKADPLHLDRALTEIYTATYLQTLDTR